MKLLRPTRPVLSTPWNGRLTDTHHAMSRNHAPKEKRPPLTHFLCLPLVNPISLPQLESSLATFKAAIPAAPSSSAARETRLREALVPPRPLIPDGALRPVGTLHFTLGVMSLPTKERLGEALEFFQSLDLAAMMHEAENRSRTRRGNGRVEPCNSSDGRGSASQLPLPFNISLESLHALPQAQSATVLHAAPVDPTARLFPFCEVLRDKFLEAGFLLESKPNPRPLLLHATVVNTIYIKGRPRRGGGGGGSSRYTFDARGILDHYNDYYLDSHRTKPRPADRETLLPPSNMDNVLVHDNNANQSSSSSGPGSMDQHKNPFIWAKDFPLDSVCICEMGAKKLDPSEDQLNTRLGEKYKAIAERSLP